MSSRIDGSNQPRPLLDKAIPEGEELTHEQQHLVDNFKDETSKTADILNQTVLKGDMGAARARVDDLKKHFESLSHDMKKEMYSELTQKGVKGGLKELFDYKLSTPSRESLLKILNPDHVSPRELSQVQIDKVKASKTGEKNLEGKLQEATLRKAFDSQFGGKEIESESRPGAIKMPTFGPSEGPGAVKMPTFGPGDGPGAVKMPQPKSDEPGSSFNPGPVKMPTFPSNDSGPGAIKMPQPKSGEPGIPFNPGPVKMPTVPNNDSGPGAIKMPEPKSKEPGIPFNPGPVKMPQPKPGDEVNTQPGIDADGLRKFLKK